MGSAMGHICRACGTRFSVRDGGGFFFDMLHCEACGRTASLGHRELGDIHLRFIKGLDHPYAVARAAMDRQIQQEYPGEPLDRNAYHAAAEATLDPCPCGGDSAMTRQPDAPSCRSTREMWDLDPTAPMMHYD